MGKIFEFEGLNLSLPYYVTRPHGHDKTTAALSMTLWMQLLVVIIVWLNIVLWGAYGIVQFFIHVIP